MSETSGMSEASGTNGTVGTNGMGEAGDGGFFAGPKDRKAAESVIRQNLPVLVEMLVQESGQMLEPGQAFDVPTDPAEQWQLYRALVNVRPPKPAPPELLRLQDQMLQAIAAWRGTTSVDDIFAATEPAAASADTTDDGTAASLSGGNMAVWRGDITTLEADAIVNAANSQMLGCFVPNHSCIDNAIHTFAGMQLREECDLLMRAQGHEEPTGQAKVTPAFNLPSKFVVHTVGPIVRGNASGMPTAEQKSQLRSCYVNCLDAAAEAGCESIAFCCVSTGVFGYPNNLAAQTAVAAVREWLESHEQPLRVVFNVFKEFDERLYRDLLAQ